MKKIALSLLLLTLGLSVGTPTQVFAADGKSTPSDPLPLYEDFVFGDRYRISDDMHKLHEKANELRTQLEISKEALKKFDDDPARLHKKNPFLNPTSPDSLKERAERGALIKVMMDISHKIELNKQNIEKQSWRDWAIAEKKEKERVAHLRRLMKKHEEEKAAAEQELAEAMPFLEEAEKSIKKLRQAEKPEDQSKKEQIEADARYAATLDSQEESDAAEQEKLLQQAVFQLIQIQNHQAFPFDGQEAMGAPVMGIPSGEDYPDGWTYVDELELELENEFFAKEEARRRARKEHR